MRIGLITMHRVIHFGSVLQAYALQQILFRLGYDNEIIDYVYPNQFHKPEKRPSIKGRIYNLLVKILRRKPAETNKIADFIKNKLVKSKHSFNSPAKLAKNCPAYDIYLTGSDQVWNTDYLKGDTSFFFSFLPADSKKVSYAASFGRFTFRGEKAKQWLENLNSYDAISVREHKAAEIIQKYTGKDVDIVLDPTLLLTKKEWEEFAGERKCIEGKYLLVYVLTYAWQPFPYALDVIESLEKETGLKVVVLEPMSLKEKHTEWTYMENLSPNEFVNLFKNASLIITTSFHGTAFSINLQRPFISIISDSGANDDRISSLCESVGLTNNLLMEGSIINNIPATDFSESQKRLDCLREDSLLFLRNSINS